MVSATESVPAIVGLLRFPRRSPLWLLGLSKSLGSAHESHEERDRGDSGNRAADERA
jgi:hypothetical protein